MSRRKQAKPQHLKSDEELPPPDGAPEHGEGPRGSGRRGSGAGRRGLGGNCWSQSRSAAPGPGRPAGGTPILPGARGAELRASKLGSAARSWGAARGRAGARAGWGPELPGQAVGVWGEGAGCRAADSALAFRDLAHGPWAGPLRPRDPRAGAAAGKCPGLADRRTRAGEAAARAALFGAWPRGGARSERGGCPDPRPAPHPGRLSAASCAPRAVQPARSRRADEPGSRSEATRKSVSPGLSNGRLGN